MIMSKLVKQKYYGDCMVACFAMLLSCRYEDALKYFKSDDNIVNGYHPQDLVDEYKRITSIEINYFKEDEIHKADWDYPLIATVPSLNIEDVSHVIYWDGNDVYDPSNKENVYDYIPDEIIGVLQFSDP